MVNPHEVLLAAIQSHRQVFLHGPNFSGRSAALQRITRDASFTERNGRDLYGHLLPPLVDRAHDVRYAYVGPEIYHALSGLAVNVRSELLLHSFGRAAAMDRLAERLGLTPLFDRGCYELSGGQQAVVAGTAAAMLQPEILALDCCLEQVDSVRRDTLLKLLSGVAPKTSLLLADNEINDPSVLADFRPVLLERDPANMQFPVIASPPVSDCLPPRIEGSWLALKNITFAYPKSARVLNGASVELQAGKVYWLRGSNGSGKTTLAKLLAGVLKPSAGEVLLDGRPIRPANSPGEIVSYHFQNPDFQLFSTTVWDEVLAGPRAMGCPPDEAVKRTGRALEHLAIPDDLHSMHPLDLPFALRKRLALAATIASGSRWMLFDEPSLGQDEQNTRSIRALADGLANAGFGVIVISHSRLMTGDLATRALEICDGHIVVNGCD